jgi:hypothetical protein
LPITTCIAIKELKLETNVGNLCFEEGLISEQAWPGIKGGQKIAPAHPIPLLNKEYIDPRAASHA